MNQQVADKIDKFFSPCPVKTYSKGETITFAGQDPAGVSLLLTRVVEKYDITPEGNKVTVNIFKPPAFFPMSWAMNKTPNTYFYAAETNVTLKQADADETVAFLQSNPDVLFDLLSRVYKGTDALLKRLVLTASGAAANRLIFELLVEAYRFGEKLSDDTARITIKQNVLAARSGLVRETVTRVLHKLEEEGAISRSNHTMTFSITSLEERLNIRT